MAIFIILLIIFAIVLFVFLIKHWLFTRNLLWNFKHCNVIVAGKKGTGKDLTFNYVINKRKQDYYSNIPYNKLYYNKVGLTDISCFPNTYLKLITDKVEKTKHKFKEGCDIYVSDIGNFLPSYMDSTLYKLFPSMPLYYSLSRHLYDSNVHCNTQNIERGWKALREQADFYVVCKRTYNIFGFLITKMITYDRYESARQGLQPMKVRLLNKFSKAEFDKYVATSGDIRKGWIIQHKSNVKYDTRAFEKILLKGKRKY